MVLILPSSYFNIQFTFTYLTAQTHNRRLSLTSSGGEYWANIFTCSVLYAYIRWGDRGWEKGICSCLQFGICSCMQFGIRYHVWYNICISSNPLILLLPPALIIAIYFPSSHPDSSSLGSRPPTAAQNGSIIDLKRRQQMLRRKSVSLFNRSGGMQVWSGGGGGHLIRVGMEGIEWSFAKNSEAMGSGLFGWDGPSVY